MSRHIRPPTNHSSGTFRRPTTTTASPVVAAVALLASFGVVAARDAKTSDAGQHAYPNTQKHIENAHPMVSLFGTLNKHHRRSLDHYHKHFGDLPESMPPIRTMAHVNTDCLEDFWGTFHFTRVAFSAVHDPQDVPCRSACRPLDVYGADSYGTHFPPEHILAATAPDAEASLYTAETHYDNSHGQYLVPQARAKGWFRNLRPVPSAEDADGSPTSAAGSEMVTYCTLPHSDAKLAGVELAHQRVPPGHERGDVVCKCSIEFKMPSLGSSKWVPARDVLNSIGKKRATSGAV